MTVINTNFTITEYEYVFEASTPKKTRYLNWSTRCLEENYINYKVFNEGIHLKIETSKGWINFYPTTGLYILPDKRKGRGVKNLVHIIKQWRGDYDLPKE